MTLTKIISDQFQLDIENYVEKQRPDVLKKNINRATQLNVSSLCAFLPGIFI